ncbi:MAG TPA: chorismate mutase, partial [Acidiferrobacteraceae bacterium]|nr:chorismate mutase [Acidiferrobacteraceae bacterium]
MKARAAADLKTLRARIDALDVRLQALIQQRARLAQRVAAVKRERGSTAARYYRPEREAEVLRKVRERDSAPLRAPDMARLFREIMSACLAVESPLTVAFLGPAGTYTEQ